MLMQNLSRKVHRHFDEESERWWKIDQERCHCNNMFCAIIPRRHQSPPWKKDSDFMGKVCEGELTISVKARRYYPVKVLYTETQSFHRQTESLFCFRRGCFQDVFWLNRSATTEGRHTLINYVMPTQMMCDLILCILRWLARSSLL